MMKRKLITFGLSALMVLSMGSSAFAADMPIATIPNTDGADNAQTPVQLTAAATAYDFSITEEININVAANTNEAASVDNLVFTNNVKTGHVSETLNLVNANSWEAKAYNTSWKDEKVNSKGFGLQADGTEDMFTTVGSTGYVAEASVAPEATDTTTFKAMVPTQSMAINDTEIGKVVVTVAWVTA